MLYAGCCTLYAVCCVLCAVCCVLYAASCTSCAVCCLRELRALPQGRWFICALGRGSDGDGLTPGRPGSVFEDSFKDWKPSGSETRKCRIWMPGFAQGVKTIMPDSLMDLSPLAVGNTKSTQIWRPWLSEVQEYKDMAPLVFRNARSTRI